MDTFRGIASYSRAYCHRFWNQLSKAKRRDEDRIPIAGDGESMFDKTRKSRLQLIVLSSAVCGIEFCYAAETAYVSPILLKIGVPEQYMTLIWCLSPLLGFFLMPFIGSGSDRCKSRLGRRRPFILLLSAGIMVGLIFVPNGKDIGLALGDIGDPPINGISNDSEIYTNTTSTDVVVTLATINATYEMVTNVSIETSTLNLNFSTNDSIVEYDDDNDNDGDDNVDNDDDDDQEDDYSYWDYITEHHHSAQHHVRGIVITVIGAVLLDFSADACQAPCRAYLLDVSVPEDHARGLAMFTMMAGFGGCLGYGMGGINWTNTAIGRALGSQVRVVFTFVLLIYAVAVTLTVTSNKETPLYELEDGKPKRETRKTKYRQVSEDSEGRDVYENQHTYGTGAKDVKSEPMDELERLGAYQTVDAKGKQVDSIPMETLPKNTTGSNSSSFGETSDAMEKETPPPISMKTYLKSVIYMPYSLRILCLTNLFCWMSLVCYSLYFTDFVGQAVYNGVPHAPHGSPQRLNYERGVRMGCWGMAVYSLSCCMYCGFIEKLVNRIGAKPVYIANILTYTVGMAILSIARTPAAVIILSFTSGIMYATIFTMPFLILAHYHSSETFEKLHTGETKRQQVRGLGTDIAMVQSMVFLAQFLLSSCMGAIVHAVSSTIAVVVSASLLSFFGAIAATRVVYLDL
ncbi:membrane-associated transporter protein-like isoform X2 [Ptychodera flava]|uniref:membrane-associated transporter protein-like isoform X2 n=1 Tax=Ptychodera flava TaxID=63121 RepID=UPI00396A044E